MFEISQIQARVADHRREATRADLAAQLPVRLTLRTRASRLGRKTAAYLDSGRSGDDRAVAPEARPGDLVGRRGRRFVDVHASTADLDHEAVR